MLIKEVASVLEKLAPVELAEEWDNVGLLIGSYDRDVTGILLSLDLSSAIVDEAQELRANLIITHHPPIFRPLQNLRLDSQKGFLWEKLLRQEISVYTLHTNYDRAAAGLNEYLAKLFNLVRAQPIEEGEPFLKLVVFLPQGYEDLVMEALTTAGAGWIGNYSHSAFQTTGTGTFLPHEGATPFIGEKGRLERVKEVRLETILPARLKTKVIRALLAVHPYEEVAYDLYPLAQTVGDVGLGRIGNLPTEVSWEVFLSRVKEVFSGAQLRCGGHRPERVKRIALLGGSGEKYLRKAKSLGAEVMITADLGHHDYLLAEELGLTLIDPGHYLMEIQGLTHLRKYLETELVGSLDRRIMISQRQIEPYYLA